jgi:type II secretory pathway pseudopilin PulG
VSNDTCGAGSGAIEKFRSWLGSDSGLATPVVVAVMSVVMLLAAGGALAALGTSEGANDDRRAKRALAAAEAGIQQAAYRLATLRPNELKCLGATGPSYAADPVGGECTPVPGTLATGMTFSYVATPKLTSGAACADIPNIATDTTSTDHCITSTGTAGAIKRRLQARVRVARGGIFAGIGLVGLEYVNLVNSDELWSDIGSNGLITGSNSIKVHGSLRVPDSAPAPMVLGSNPPTVRQPDPWSLAQTDFAAIAAGPNNNAALTGLSGWNATTRVLAFGNSVNITIPAGTYLICDLYGDNSIKINLHSNATPTNPVKIYIDSPSRPGSGCPAGSGRLCLDNSVEFNKDGNPGDLEIYIYGSTAKCSDAVPGMPFDGAHFPSDSPFVLGNSVHYFGTIYAPTTRVRLNNSVTVSGGIAALSAELANSVKFTHADAVKNKAPAAGPVRRLSWVECRSQPTTVGDHESGCT